MRRLISNLIFLAIILLGAGLWAWSAKPWESGAERAFRFCEPCGATQDEVDELILIASDPNARQTVTESFISLRPLRARV